MRVLIVNTMVPFVWGGAEELAVNLEKNLQLFGYDAEILKIPFRWDPAETILSQMLMVRTFELSQVDRVIALKFPAYLIRHPQKTLWILHQHRQAYDLYDANKTNISNSKEDQQIKKIIHAADVTAVCESRSVYTISKVTQERLQKYNGLSAKILIPPINDAEIFTGGKSEGYIFAGGRINASKRQHLLIEALSKVKANIKLIIAGPPDTLEDADRLKALVEKNQLQDRVKLDLRFLARAEVAAYVNGALACAYLPYDEDSLGYVTMEAATAAKPVITTNDSGGVLGLVTHQQTGWVVEPTAEGVANAISMIISNPQAAAEMGVASQRKCEALGMTWTNTVEQLLK